MIGHLKTLKAYNGMLKREEEAPIEKRYPCHSMRLCGRCVNNDPERVWDGHDSFHVYHRIHVHNR